MTSTGSHDISPVDATPSTRGPRWRWSFVKCQDPLIKKYRKYRLSENRNRKKLSIYTIQWAIPSEQSRNKDTNDLLATGTTNEAPSFNSWHKRHNQRALFKLPMFNLPCSTHDPNVRCSFLVFVCGVRSWSWKDASRKVNWIDMILT